jgi:nucleoside-diphosphate-sugar epimerase
VIDTVIYKGDEAEVVVKLLSGHIGHYLFLSSGQVYLVREGLARPFKEQDYSGPLMPPPMSNTFGYEEWLYGVEKRQVEDTLAAAWATHQFPYTSLRIPMVNSARDTFKRLYNYIVRLKDGGPILVPDVPNYPLRHVYAQDVARILCELAERRVGIGRAYNISQDETVSLEQMLALVGQALGVLKDEAQPPLLVVKRAELEANGFLPDCSPFSERWMSELDNTLSKTELGLHYTPLPQYLAKLVAAYQQQPPPTPASYKRRRAERAFAQSLTPPL